jgi:hypothetical protein
VSDYLVTSHTVPIAGYHDLFGNWITRIVAPAGHLRLAGHAIVYDSGHPDMVWPSAIQHEVQDLPAETLEFLLGSRYCETDHLSEIAWGQFGASPLGWGRVQAICLDGDACKQSATSPTTIKNLATSMHARPKQLGGIVQ